MKCPFCGTPDTLVSETRLSEEGDSVRRRRRCTVCEKRFTTFETVELRMPQVVKQNGQRVEFDSDKLRQSFLRPLHKRAVPIAEVDAALTKILQSILAQGFKEIPSREIGERVMNALKQLDHVAYIRFASIYRRFKDTEDFQDAIREVQSSQKK